jgi:hypothetical protein
MNIILNVKKRDLNFEKSLNKINFKFIFKNNVYEITKYVTNNDFYDILESYICENHNIISSNY